MSSGSSGGTTIVQPSYGDSLREALEAQTALLTGTQVGESDFSMFNEIGGLEGLVKTYERPLRMTSAQVDTDVLRQTLLGNRTPVYADAQTPAQTTAQSTEQSTAQTTQPTEETTGGITPNPMKAGSLVPNTTPGMPVGSTTTTPYGIGTIEPGGQVKLIQPYSDEQYSGIFQATQKAQTSEGSPQRRATQTNVDYGGQVDPNTGKIVTGYSDEYKDQRVAALINGLKPGPENQFKNLQLINANKDWLGEPNTTDLAGKVILGQAGDLVKTIRDLYPDGLDRVPIYKKDADGNDIVVPLDADGNPITQADESTTVGGQAGTTVNVPGRGEQTLPELPPGAENPTPTPAREVVGYERSGDGLIDLLGDRRMAIDPTTGLPSERMSGFSEDDKFLGLAALAEDIQRGNLSRQREADISDVQRLSSRYKTIMDDFKPATASGVDDARLLLEQQRENLTGLRKATQEDVDAGNASEVGELFQTGSGQGGIISMPNALDPQNYGMSGDAAIGTTDTGEDTLRSALLADAKSALGDGLSDRETRAIQNSARARSGLMGRTFDQSGAIEESKALIQDDNNRRMQNRAFAQSALGQEATIQQGDVSRAMTTDQFNVGAKMDAERLNESLRQQGLGNYINAVGNLAQIEDKYTLDPFQAILGRAGGGSLQAGQGIFGQAGYGLQSGPQYLNPEAGLGYISNQYTNMANMYAADAAANATRDAGMMNMFGGLGGGIAGGLIGLAG